MKMNQRLYAAALAALLLIATAVAPYPLDGYGETGIRRLEANRLAQEGKLNDVRQPPGALERPRRPPAESAPAATSLDDGGELIVGQGHHGQAVALGQQA